MTGDLLRLVLGMVLLYGAAEALVRGASRLAESLGLAPLVVGLTVVAFGTSAPEMVVSVVGAVEGRTGVALGNVIGSNIFNTLAVLGLPAIIHPGPIPPEVLTRDLPVMVALTLLLIPVLAHRSGGRGRIGRWEGLLLVSCFVAYEGYLFATL